MARQRRASLSSNWSKGDCVHNSGTACHVQSGWWWLWICVSNSNDCNMATECECSFGLLYQALDPRDLVITSCSASMQSYISLQKIMSQNWILQWFACVLRASLSRDLQATGFAGTPPLLTFLFCKDFSFHKFIFLEYHNLYTQLWSIISIYKFCHITFKHNF
jgi:hypothetical protein